jgi:hypothetical protein
MKAYKVTSMGELMGVRATSEEGLLTALCGQDPVHPTVEGYKRMAKSLIEMVESPKGAFNGEKRERAVHEEVGMIGNEDRLEHEWLYEVVSETGSWKGSRARGREDTRTKREDPRQQRSKGQRFGY